MKIRDVMSHSVEWVAPDASLQEIAQMMNSKDIGSVPVVEQDKLLGIVTDRDIVVRAIAAGKNPSATIAKDIMSTQISTVTPDSDAHEASAIMSKEQIRRLPVVENGKLVGMLALGDLAVERIHENEAGEALSDISQGVHH